MENNNIDLIEQIRTIVAPLAKKPESILIRRLDKPEDLETLINVIARKYKKRVHLSFESFGEEE